jgi:hypothetical protein
MKKIIPIVIIIIIGSLLLAGSFLGTIVKKGVETVGPDIAGVAITLESAKVSAIGGSASLTNLVVGNPEGFTSDHAFKLGNIGIDLDVASLMSDTIVINAIYINGPSISYELGLGGTNINKIASNVSAGSASSQTSEAPKEEKSGAGKKVIINHVYIRAAKIQAGVGKAQASISIPDIHLTDIGKESQGTSFPDATQKVMAAITKEIASADLSGLTDLDSAKDAIMDGAKDKLNDVTKGLKGLF